MKFSFSIVLATALATLAAAELTPKACIAKDGVCYTGADGYKGSCCPGLECIEVIQDLKHCKTK